MEQFLVHLPGGLAPVKSDLPDVDLALQVDAPLGRDQPDGASPGSNGGQESLQECRIILCWGHPLLAKPPDFIGEP
jgi:hypothetical protein